MDKEQARYILRCFRADGADAGNPDFEGALRMAAEDRELGEWLASERAHDATFGEALTSIPLPCDLRAAILAGLAAERGKSPQTMSNADRLMADAIASVKPPTNLRERILVSMRRSVGVPPRWGIAMTYWAAAAAGIVAAFIMVRPHMATDATARRDPEAPSRSSTPASLPIEVVKIGFIKELESPSFSLDLKKPDQRELFEHLKRRALPCPCCMPRGLSAAPGVGCRELVIEGRRGSVLCFRECEGSVVHLMVFRCDDICGDLPERDHPQIGQCGGWATASWKHGGQVFVLMGKTDPKKLASLI